MNKLKRLFNKLFKNKMEITTIIATLSNGSTVTLFPVATPTPVTPVTVSEVDVKTTDGETKIFIPQA